MEMQPMNGKRLMRRLARRARRLPPLILTVSLAVTLAACATSPRTESILDVLANEPRSAGPACVQSEALVCESAGLRSRLDRRCSCVDRTALDPTFH